MAHIERTLAPEEHHNVAAGIGLMLLAMLVYSANDALGKWLTGSYSAGQILLFRSAAALIVLVPFIRRLGVASFIRIDRPGLQATRALLSAGESACFYVAVTSLPLADTMTYYLASPIFVTVLAALVLGERIGWRRWSAVAIGFAGVMVALRPSTATVSWPALVAILGSTLFSLLMVATRLLRATHGVATIGWQMVASLLVGAVAAPFAWAPVDPVDAALLGTLGVVAMAAAACVNRSLKLAPASLVVPYQYTVIVWAAVFGYLVFGDLPAPAVVVGATVIIGAGLFIYLREQAVARRPREDLVAEH